MEHNHEKKTSVLSATLLIATAFILIVTLFFLSSQKSNSSILLPDGTPGFTQGSNNAVSQQDNFLKVTSENVQSVIRTMSREESYHQVCNITLSQEDRINSQVADIWVDGNLLRADIASITGTASILTDGNTAYLWHSEEDGYSVVTLSDEVSVDDLLGLPTYEQILDWDNDKLTEASYLVHPEYGNQCIYVSVAVSDHTTHAYWIDISSGLLFMATACADEEVVYTLEQNDLERLAAGDEAFADRFLLPDGGNPFSGE